MSILTDPYLLQLVVGVPKGNNSYEDQEIYFDQYTHGDINSCRIFLLGYVEDDALHKKILSTYLRSVAGPQDLILSGYVNLDETIAQGGKMTQKHEVYQIPLLGGLLQELIKTGVTIKGWDKTSLKEQIIEITLTSNLLNTRSINILFGQRNDYLVNAVINDEKNYRNIYVLAGAAHFCIATIFSNCLKAQLEGEVKEIQQRTLDRLKDYQPIILMPLLDSVMMNKLKISYCFKFSLKCYAIAFIGLLLLQISKNYEF